MALGDPKPHPKPQETKRQAPRRAMRQKAGRERWQEICAKKLGPCVVCLWLGLPQLLPSSLHHVVSKSLGGSDCESNCVSVCGSGTTGHHGLIEAHDVPTCQAFAAAVQLWDGDAYSYAIQKLGEDGFLRRYKVAFVNAAAEPTTNARSAPVGRQRPGAAA